MTKFKTILFPSGVKSWCILVFSLLFNGAQTKQHIHIKQLEQKMKIAKPCRRSLIELPIALLFLMQFASADCLWTVNGTVKVETQESELSGAFGSIIPLKNIEVKVSGSTAANIFDSWGTVRTDALGKFTLAKQKSCEDRKLKVEVQFVDDRLKIIEDPGAAPTTGAKWLTIIQDKEKIRKPGTVQIVPTIFASGKPLDLSNQNARSHADIWVMANALLDQVNGYGSDFVFKHLMTIEYPNNDEFISDAQEASFANPLTGDVNIFKSKDGTQDELSVAILYHEMMHVWAYQHTSGELDMATNLLITGDTHCHNSKEHVSFHEGFAEFAMEKLKEEIYPKSVTGKTLPFNRDALNEGLACRSGVDAIRSLEALEEHEFGWMSLLRMLTTRNLHEYTYAGEATSTNRMSSSVFISKASMQFLGTCETPTNRNLKGILDVFLPHPHEGFNDFLSKGEMLVSAFMDRASRINGFVDQRVPLTNLLDPSKTSEPQQELCATTSIPRTGAIPNTKVPPPKIPK